jgi:hypothetical protein
MVALTPTVEVPALTRVGIGAELLPNRNRRAHPKRCRRETNGVEKKCGHGR